MKLYLYLYFFAIIACSWALTEDQTKKMEEFSKACREESGLSLDMVEKLRKFEKVDHEKVEEHMRCVSKKIGLVKENGEFDMDVLKNRVKAAIDVDQMVERIMKRCGAHVPQESILDNINCFHRLVPNYSPVE